MRVGERLDLIFCGGAADVAATADGRVRLCRSLGFDPRTGALVGKTDGPDHRFEQSVAALDANGIRIEATRPQDSKTGAILVRDIASGRERQRIVSVAQRPLSLSPDGRWLVTHATDQKKLRIYRVTQ